MRNLRVIGYLSFFILFSHCGAVEVPESCIDESRINSMAACYMIYAPVCGCDKKTYGNDCIAINSGVNSFTLGPCGD
jgi:hypothetical protein